VLRVHSDFTCRLLLPISLHPSLPPSLPSFLHSFLITHIVDSVNLVFRRRLQGDKFALVLLHHRLLRLSQATDRVQVRHALIRAVGDNLARHGRVHARETHVDTDVGVVDIDLVAAAQEADTCKGGREGGKEDGE